MATDAFSQYPVAPTSPYETAAAVAPSDAADLAEVTRGLMVTAAGNVAVVMRSGAEVVLPALQPGTIYPVRVRRVRATGTTATGILALA